MVWGSLTRARRLGDAVLTAQRKKESPVAAILSCETGRLLIFGKVRTHPSIQHINLPIPDRRRTENDGEGIFKRPRHRQRLRFVRRRDGLHRLAERIHRRASTLRRRPSRRRAGQRAGSDHDHRLRYRVSDIDGGGEVRLTRRRARSRRSSHVAHETRFAVRRTGGRSVTTTSSSSP